MLRQGIEPLTPFIHELERFTGRRVTTVPQRPTKEEFESYYNLIQK